MASATRCIPARTTTTSTRWRRRARRTGPRGGRAARDARPRRRASGPHARAHLHPHRPVREVGEEQRGCGARGREATSRCGASRTCTPAIYYGHNLQFESAAAMFAGNFAEAREAAQHTVPWWIRSADAWRCCEPYALQDGAVLCGLALGRDPRRKAPAAHTHRADRALSLHAGRGLAGQGKVADAVREQQALEAGDGDRWPKDAMIGPANAGRAECSPWRPPISRAAWPGAAATRPATVAGVHQRGGGGGSPRLQRAARLAAARARAAGRGAAGHGRAADAEQCFARTSRATSAIRARCSACGRASRRRGSRTRRKRDVRSRPRSRAPTYHSARICTARAWRPARPRPARRSSDPEWFASTSRFLAVTAVFVVTPGSTTAVVVRNTLAGGRRAGLTPLSVPRRPTARTRRSPAWACGCWWAGGRHCSARFASPAPPTWPGWGCKA